VKDKEESSTTLGGNVTGPAASTDGSLAQFDGITGQILKDGPAIGIAQNNLVKVSDAAALNGELAAFSATGLEGKTKAEALAILNVADGATANTKATGAEVDTGTDDSKFATSKALKDSHNVPSVAPSTAGKVMRSNGTDWISEAPGIADNKILEVDDASAASGEYARFTANGIEGVTKATVAEDLSGSFKGAQFAAEYDNENSGASKTINWNNGAYQKIAISESTTLSFTAPSSGVGRLQLKITNGGAFTVALPTYKSPGAEAFVMTSGNGKIDILNFFYDGTTYFLLPSQNFGTPA
jgi:hypothetical protein